MTQKLEINVLIHLIIIALVLFGAYKYNGYNIFKEYTLALEDTRLTFEKNIDLATQMLYDEMENSNKVMNLEIETVRAENLMVVRRFVYLLEYYAPAILMTVLIGFVYLETRLIKYIKLNYNKYSIKKNKNVDTEKLKEVLRQDALYKFRRINFPRSLTITYLVTSFVYMIVNVENEILKRALENFLFVGTFLITFYGFRVIINFFKTSNKIANFSLILLNCFVALVCPQIFFVIGLLQSLISIRIVVRKIKK